MSSSYKWSSDKEAYLRKVQSKIQLTGQKTDKHPLQSAGLASKISLDNVIVDTLNLEEMDPLTRMATDDLIPGPGHSSTSSIAKMKKIQDTFEPWSVKKLIILNKFTTLEKLSLTTSSFSNEHQVRSVSEKTLQRLEQLDLDVGSKQYFGGLSQDEYINKINQLDQSMKQAWNSDLRVNALKIAIQCCKLLSDTSVISFYPSKFVIITDILDKFGEMVYNRLKGKQSEILPAEVVKETSKNWFFKVGSIRELLPRISIEMAILKSYSFIQSNSPDFGRIFVRLLNSIWGIGDPVVSIYLRSYLVRKAMELIPDHKEIYMQCFQDILMLHDHVLENFKTNPQFVENKVSMDTYMNVLSPAIEWILQCLVHRGDHLNYTVQLVSNIPSSFWKSVLLSSVLSTFPPSFIGDQCIHILDMTQTLENNLGPLIKNLGMCLVISEPQIVQAKEIWKRTWPFIKDLQNREQYLSCIEVWTEFVVKYFGNELINSFIEDILAHITYRDVEKFNPKLVNIVEKLITFSKDIISLLLMDKFIKLVTMLRSNLEVIKSVIEAFNSKHNDPLADNIVINTLMHLSTILHDSVDALTPFDEVKQIGNIINGFIVRVDFGRDYEKQLQFYDEARGAFTNIDFVLVQLIQCVCKLGMKVREMLSGYHTKRTRSFLSACIAYAFITIPSLESVYSQLQLYLLTSQVAYCNQCVSQGDSCLKAAITLLNENVQTGRDLEFSEQLLIEYVNNLMSCLLCVPDHENEPMLYLLKALMTIDWQSPIIPLRSLSLLGALSQEKYAYYFTGVDANDSLYGSDTKFLEEIDLTATSILNQLLLTIKNLGDQQQLKKQARISLELFLEILIWGDLGQMGQLALNLWNLSKKNIDHKLAIKTLESVKRKSHLRKEYQVLFASKVTLNS